MAAGGHIVSMIVQAYAVSDHRIFGALDDDLQGGSRQQSNTLDPRGPGRRPRASRDRDYLVPQATRLGVGSGGRSTPMWRWIL